MSTDESLAKALGWKQRNFGYWQSPDGRYDLAMPLWTEDMNACLRDIVPVLLARGMRAIFVMEEHWLVSVNKGLDSFDARNVSLPAAFCEAALKALEATKPTAVAH